MVLALAGDSTMTSALPPGVDGSSSSGMYAALRPPRLAVAFFTAFFFAAALAPVARFLAPETFFVAISAPSVIGRLRQCRRSRHLPLKSGGHRVQYDHRSG